MHNAAFRHFGVDATYELLELAPSDLDDFFAQVRGDEWLGFQITAPYKQEAFQRCDDIEPQAARIGAVNSVIRNDDGSLTGFNTDAPGFVDAVALDLERTFEDAEVCVAGAGGAALATSDLAVNATTVGMTSEGTAFDPVHLDPARAAVFDLVYIPPVTELLARCGELNIPAANGLSMLVSQAAIAFTRWTGVADPGPVMRRALEAMPSPTAET